VIGKDADTVTFFIDFREVIANVYCVPWAGFTEKFCPDKKVVCHLHEYLSLKKYSVPCYVVTYSYSEIYGQRWVAPASGMWDENA
jgi:hypothetical protein